MQPQHPSSNKRRKISGMKLNTLLSDITWRTARLKYYNSEAVKALDSEGEGSARSVRQPCALTQMYREGRMLTLNTPVMTLYISSSAQVPRCECWALLLSIPEPALLTR